MEESFAGDPNSTPVPDVAAGISRLDALEQHKQTSVFFSGELLERQMQPRGVTPKLDPRPSQHPRSRPSMSASEAPSPPHHFRANSMDGSDQASPLSFFGGEGGLAQSSGGGRGLPVTSTDSSSRSKSKDKAKSLDKDADGSPSWAELKTKAGKDRKRLPLACITCRRKKIRCSGEKPACKHCLRSRIPCVYKVTTRKAAPRTDYMAMLDKRLKRMEERVIKIMPKDEQRNVDVIGRAVVKPALVSTTVKPESNKRPADKAFSEDLEHWATTNPRPGGAGTRTGDEPRDDLMTEGASFLPSTELQQHLAEVYFDFVYGQSYHLLHKPSYMRKLEAGQLPPVIILAVCAIAARFSSHPEVRTDPVFLRGERWARPARMIALKRYDTPNIAILICYLLLGLHEFGTCQGGRSWMLGGMAQRMAYALQLHKDLDSKPSQGPDEQDDLTFTDREIRRRTMWACFMMDRFNSSGTDRPMFVAESYIEAQLPIREQFFQMEIMGPTERLDEPASNKVELHSGQITDPKENMGVAAYMVRAVCVWGQVVRYVNLGGRERDDKPMWSADSGFARIKKLYEDCCQHLPDSLQWNEDNLQAHVGERIANQYIFMHIIMNQIKLFLNRFALPSSGTRTGTHSNMPEEFVDECARAARDAAGQISTLVNEAHDHRVVAPFAGYCAFLSSTVHIQGLSSLNSTVEAASKQYLAWNVKYLSNMKKYWGMFHFVTEHLKDLYRKQMDTALRAQQGQTTPAVARTQEGIFQYGDWFDRYPHGVSGTDYEDAGTDVKKATSDAIFGQKPDLQSVEEFFAKMSPPSRSAPSRKMAKKKQSKAGPQTAAPATAVAGTGGDLVVDAQMSVADPSRQPSQMQSVEQQQQQQPQPQSQSIQMPLAGSPGFGGRGLSDQNFYRQQGQQQGFGRGTMASEMAMFQQMANPSVMAQMDRQMVLSSYVGMGGSGRNTPLQNITMAGVNSLGFGADLDMQGNSGGGPFHFGDDGTGQGANINVPWSTSNNHQAGPMANSTNGMSADMVSWGDPSSLSWFMPFNVDPPSGLGDDADLFGGSYDFSNFAGLGGGEFGAGERMSVGAEGMGNGNDGLKGPAGGQQEHQQQ